MGKKNVPQYNVPITLFTTGGTFDKIYNPQNGTLLCDEKNKTTFIHEIIKDANLFMLLPSLTIPPPIMSIDSDFMDDNNTHYEIIAQACQNANDKNIVITHGTSKIVQCANYISKKKINKTICLVGAMRPYTLRQSDAHTNLVAALTVCPFLPKGVYICGGGMVFPHDNISKDAELAEYYSLDASQLENWYDSFDK